MKNYWSCSKLADWLRGTPKLEMGTSGQWRDWKKESKSKHPIRYWIAEEGLDHLQDFLTWPEKKLNDIRYYIVNRWVTRTHCLTSDPKDLPRGEWADVGNRFLPCLFNELVDFVEIEQAWSHVMWDDEARKKYKCPWYRTGWLRWRTWRCPEAGIDHLKWASNLVWDESDYIMPTDPRYGQPTEQAKGAREILELYTWWTEVYRNRPDPMDASGWSAYCDRMRIKYPDEGFFGSLGHKTPEDEIESKRSHALLQKMEEYNEREEEEMMIRLIKARNRLWT